MVKQAGVETLTLDDIERKARDLYINDRNGQQKLLDTWEQIPTHAQHRYPEIAFHTAKVYINQGNHALARARLTICADAWKGEPENLARVYLLHAYLCNLEHDNEGLRHFIIQVHALSKNEILLAECQYLLGEAALSSDPAEALKHYDESRLRYARASATDHNATFDLVRACLRASLVAFQQNMRVIGWQYQRYAEEAARGFANSDLLSAVLLRSGEAWEHEGQYEQALTAYQQASEQAMHNPQKRVALAYRRARIALLMNDDKVAYDIISQPIESDHAFTMCRWLLCQGWWYAFQYDSRGARHKLDEALVIARDEQKLVYEAHLLRGLIAAIEGRPDTATIQNLMGAMDYFDDQRRVIEASQARLILAWCQALSRDVMAVTIIVSRLEADLQQIGHVRHLARLYQTSLALLGGWWQAQTVAAMEHVLDASRFLGGVRVYAFGVPQVYLQGGELIQRDRYGRAGIRLLIYMLEKRQATLWEIVEALWEGGDPQSGQKRFHDLMSNFKKTIGSPDWCVYSQERRVYVVKEGFPDYYDASDFKMTYAWFTSSEDTMQSLAQALKLINLYDTFAKTFEGDAFDDLRHEYDALFDHMIGQSEQLLPALADRVPRNWYQQLVTSINVNRLA